MCGGRCEWARELEREWELEPEWARVCEAERASPFAVTVDVALFPDAAEVVEKVEMVVAVVAVEAAETLVIAEAYDLVSKRGQNGFKSRVEVAAVLVR